MVTGRTDGRNRRTTHDADPLDVRVTVCVGGLCMAA